MKMEFNVWFKVTSEKENFSIEFRSESCGAVKAETFEEAKKLALDWLLSMFPEMKTNWDKHEVIGEEESDCVKFGVPTCHTYCFDDEHREREFYDMIKRLSQDGHQIEDVDPKNLFFKINNLTKYTGVLIK